jgi:hypothetical protein
MHNPLLDAFNKNKKERRDTLCLSLDYYTRMACVKKYAWAIPNEEAIKRIATLSPIIEIGAGGGYWARLLKKVGANITPFDKHGCTHKRNCYVDVLHMRVKRGDWKQLRKREFANHTLMLCWPPYNDPMACNCLKAFRGSTVVMIGEGSGGCTGNDDSQVYLDKYFEEIDSIRIPQWSGIHDYVQIYKRT